MGLLDRIAFITRSKANALMDSLEDPREAINQTIADASVEYAKVKAAAAKVIAGETSAKNTLEEYEKKHAQYEKAAENAVLAGDDASDSGSDHPGTYGWYNRTWYKEYCSWLHLPWQTDQRPARIH